MKTKIKLKNFKNNNYKIKTLIYNKYIQIYNNEKNKMIFLKQN